jgi:hypothetical protein
MKKSIIVLLAALLLAVSCGMAFGEEKKEEGAEGVEVEVGLKAWYSYWKNQDPDPTAGTTRFDPALLVGPAIEVRLPYHFYLEGSYLVSLNDYEYSLFGAKLTADRKDLDLAVGYRIIPEVGIFAGYKNVDMDLTVLGFSAGSLNLSGPFIGIRGDVPVNEALSVYAVATYLDTESETNVIGEFTTKYDAPGSIFELGVKAAFNKELSGTLGYKVESTKEDVTNIKDTFSGFTLGVMYAF